MTTAIFRNSDGWKLERPEPHPRPRAVDARADAGSERAAIAATASTVIGITKRCQRR